MSAEMHWARWGDPERATALTAAAKDLVDAVLGTTPTPSVTSDQVRLSPPLDRGLVGGLERLVGREHVLTDDHSRLHHTRGKSTPDLLLLRAGDGSAAPGAVVRPASHDEVQAVLDWATSEHVAVVPFGGGTSVVGGLAVGGLAVDGASYAGVVALDLVRLDRLVEVDAVSCTAALEAGVRGPDAERLLGEHGMTLGHLPQSFEYASIGGFAATRSSGQASSGYGRFDDLVVGVTVATPVGRVDLGVAPATAAGPDLRQWMLGSEGAFGVITAVRVRVHPVPEVQVFESWRLPDFGTGVDAVRQVAQCGLPPTVLRLSDETETAVNLADPERIGEDAGGGSGGCSLVVGYDGTEAVVRARRGVVGSVLTAAGAARVDTDAGEAWASKRFDGPYLRDALLDVGVLVETLETAAFWSRLPAVYAAARDALQASLEPVIVLAHVSHVYETGASLYFTVASPQGSDPVGTWQRTKAVVTQALVDAGGTITHHHAVGRDHRPWLAREVGDTGVAMLRAVKRQLDPADVLNPGVLLPPL